jgi:hypothetical protein
MHLSTNLTFVRIQTGEYFGVEPGISTAYCRGGKKMIVFIVVVPLKTGAAAADAAMHTESCPFWNMVVVQTAEHQLPLGILSFASVCPKALQRSTVAQQKLQQLSLELRKASSAKVKAKIIQTYIQHSIDVAGELCVMNKDFLCDTSKMEISMYLHSVEDEDVISYYFPDLPDPMIVF